MDWVNTIVQGVLLGGLYALFAAGLSLIFGVMRLVNIAHGDLIVLAAYLALVVDRRRSASVRSSSLLVVVPLMAALGYALQRGRAQPHARRRPPAAAAGHLRPVGHHPERAARALHRRQPPAAGRARSRSRACSSAPASRSACCRSIQFVAAVAVIGGAAARVLPHRARPRLPRHLRRPGGRPADGPRQPPHLRARHGAVAGGRRRRRRLPRACAPISIPRSGRRG